MKMARTLAAILLLSASVTLLGQTPTPTATPFFVPGDPDCGQFGVLTCPGSSAGAQLTTGDCRLSDGSFFDVFRFSGTQGQAVTITLTSGAFDTYLFLLDPDGNSFLENDDFAGGGTNSRLQVSLPSTGAWTVLANSFELNRFGPYRLSLSCGGGVAPTATPLPGPAPDDIPTLSLSAVLLLSLGLAAGGLALLRRG
jgi:pre-peptidase